MDGAVRVGVACYGAIQAEGDHLARRHFGRPKQRSTAQAAEVTIGWVMPERFQEIIAPSSGFSRKLCRIRTPAAIR